VSKFLNTFGNRRLAVAICDRCRRKVAHDALRREPDTRMRVCDGCYDERDPHRYAKGRRDRPRLPWVRPEEPLVVPPPSATIYTLTFEAGSLALTGHDLALTAVVPEPDTALEAGVLVLTGYPVILRYSGALQAAAGSFALTGHPVLLTYIPVETESGAFSSGFSDGFA